MLSVISTTTVSAGPWTSHSLSCTRVLVPRQRGDAERLRRAALGHSGPRPGRLRRPVVSNARPDPKHLIDRRHNRPQSQSTVVKAAGITTRGSVSQHVRDGLAYIECLFISWRYIGCGVPGWGVTGLVDGITQDQVRARDT